VITPLDPLYDAIRAGTLEPDMAEAAKSASPLCLAMSVDDRVHDYPHVRLFDHYIVSLCNLQMYPNGPGPPPDVWIRATEGRGPWKLLGQGSEAATTDKAFWAAEMQLTRPGTGPEADEADTVVRKLLLVSPPRHGKSTEVTEWTPRWFLTRYPRAPVLISTYSGDFAEKWGAAHKDFLESDLAKDMPLAADGEPLTSLSATNANISFRSGKDVGEINYRGLAGATTGTGFVLGIIDDPFKDSEEALSPAYRTAKKNWYTSVFESRETNIKNLPPPVQVMMLTRWHEDDLAGAFALEEDGETPKPGWAVLRLPALAEPGGSDPLGRQEGESLCPQMMSKDTLEQRLNNDPVWFSCVYQGSPIHSQGNMFRKTLEHEGSPSTFHHYRYDYQTRTYRGPGEQSVLATDPATVHFMIVDLAASKKTQADWTVFTNWAFDPWKNQLILVDRFKDRLSTDDHLPKLELFLEAQRPEAEPLVIGIEAKTYGTNLINDIRTSKPDWVIIPIKAEFDKITRNTPYSVATNTGHVWFPDPLYVPWGVNWENEHTNFPRGTHDDQVDNGGYAWIHSRTYLRPGETPPGEEPEDLPKESHVQRNMRQLRRQGGKEHPYDQMLRLVGAQRR